VAGGTGLHLDTTKAALAVSAPSWRHIVVVHEVGPERELVYINGAPQVGLSNGGARPVVKVPFVVEGFIGSVDELAL
jgi:hypothetical protein